MREDSLNNQKKFLSAYARCGRTVLAAKVAKVGVRTVYHWRKNPEFQRQLDKAREVALQLLEDEAWRRAVKGVVRKKFTAKGDPIIDPATGAQYVERTYSDQLLQQLLRANLPEKYAHADAKIEAAAATTNVQVYLPENSR